MKQSKGFTLLELVIVMVVLATLCAIALPRFVDMSEDAQKTAVITTASGFYTAVKLMNSKWALGGKPVGTGLTLTEISSQYGKIVFANSGFPSGFTLFTFSAAGGGSTSDMTQVTYSAGNASNLLTLCQDLMSALLSDNSVSVQPLTGFNQGQYRCASSGQFCANIVYSSGTNAVTGCDYGYNGGTDSFTYYPATGSVVIDDPMVTH